MQVEEPAQPVLGYITLISIEIMFINSSDSQPFLVCATLTALCGYLEEPQGD